MSEATIVEYDKAAAERRAERIYRARRATWAADRTAEDSHVYFVQIGAGGPVKIGRAVDVEQRIRALQTACPYPLHLRGIAIYGGSRMEARLHRTFASDRLMGEWFRPSPFLFDVISDCGGFS